MFSPLLRLHFSTPILAVLLFVAGVSEVDAAPQREVTAADVQQAIDEAIRYFRANQNPDGSWPEYQNYQGGCTALVTLSLLNAGVDPDAPVMRQALAHLEARKFQQTYVVALQTMVFCAANPNRYAPQIKENAKWLIINQLSNGGWSYGRINTGDPDGDPSNSQFALLALHEAQRSGLSFPAATWRKVFTRAKNYWEQRQLNDGSFNYNRNEPGRGSMTCAGIASLIIVGAQLGALSDGEQNRIRCCGDTLEGEKRIEMAFKWLANNFQITKNPNYRTYHFYYLYALERAGRLSGRRFIGDHDWFREGAEVLVASQERIRGAIVPRFGLVGNQYTETAFALLFLAKGKRQIVVSRAKFGRTADWNNHSFAIQHLTAHTEQAWKRDLTWQTIDISRSSLEELLETPVLFIAGSKAPNFTDRQKRLLKEYVEQGGFIFAEATQGNGCNGSEFEEYFKKLVVELFEQPLERLPPDHPIWFAQSKVNAADLPDDAWLYGVQTCCRLGVVYSPLTLSCRWELNLPYGIKPRFGKEARADLDASTKIGVNVLTYATGEELKEKLDTVTILEDVKQETPTERGLFVLPKLQHNAGFDDAPKAVPNLVKWLDKANPFQISSERRVIPIDAKTLQEHPVVFIHGRGTFKLSEQKRETLRNYLENGGFLFADAICADEAFAKSFRSEIELLLGTELEDIPSSHPLMTKAFYGFDIKQVKLIDPDRSNSSISAATRNVVPKLQIAKLRNRPVVVFSPFDLSCALESRHSLQCKGYVREDAARIGINVVLFGLQN